MASWDRNTIILLDLVKQPENARCADCGAPVIFTSKLDPDWASYKLGVFVCLNCSGTHRDLTDVSRVKSIRLDNWEDDLVEFMRRNGNAVAKAQYEKSVPAFYYRPQQHDCVVLRDQWIRAKYARQEFTGKNGHLQKAYSSAGFCDGTLWKKGKNKRQFQKRRFVLSQDDFTLRYFIKEDSKVAKAIISVRNMNAVFQPEKVGHQNGLQITYMTEDRTRNLFVYHENGQEIVNWFNAVRAVRYAYLRKALAPANDSELMPLLTTRSLKEGYMEKTGPMQWEPFKRRWFVLCSVDRKLLYFKTPMELEQRDWIKAFQQVIAQPLLPQHYSIEANMKRKKS
ncbi:arf-GAP with dual PH domain-containing protein 1 isoform X5 [Denticeps clupeoides]|uniref:arf-GAP with dual PH domain-containing protein 1 isoform X5 n=1 Tax=Denticeps clupeoides TaxID=299321 RepID=UPI0010A4AEE0|nr:arf-GAP with dual PH domain-containing protein 2 isoform X5 [Denticeps clupeoides]